MNEEVLKCIPSVQLTNPVLKGDDGGFYTPEVDESGNLTWKPSEIDMPAVEGKNIKGPQGPAGKTPIKGVDYFDGKDGKPGKDGINGVDGKDALINGVNTLNLVEGNNITLVQQGDTLTISAIGGGGSGGENGATFIPSVSYDGEISWTNDKGLPNPSPVNIQGPAGRDGLPGADGKNGLNGSNGEDGVSPSASIQQTESGATITITDRTGTTTATLTNGKDGKQGLPGKDGLNGTDGKDGAIGPVGPAGESGVYRGVEEPTDPDIKVWLNPNGSVVKYATEEYVNNYVNNAIAGIANYNEVKF